MRGDKSIKQKPWYFPGVTREKPRASDWVGTGLATSLLEKGGDTRQTVGVYKVSLSLSLQKNRGSPEQLKLKIRAELNPISQGGDFSRKRTNAPPSSLPWVSLPGFGTCLRSNTYKTLEESQKEKLCSSHGSVQHGRVRGPRGVWGQSPN